MSAALWSRRRRESFLQLCHELGAAMSMRNCVMGLGLSLAITLLTAGAARAAENYEMDGMHSGVTFKISHVGLSWVFGRFNDLSGNFTIDPSNPAGDSFAMTIKTESIDTNNRKRDEHLSSPDFFNVKQFPAIAFQSTAVKPGQDGYQVTGDLTMHGVTKPVTFTLKGGKAAEFPKGVRRTGFATQLALKRSDFGIDKFADMLGDDVYIEVSFEGTLK
jgi:polyisoprenoid-binding protein YceI